MNPNKFDSQEQLDQQPEKSGRPSSENSPAEFGVKGHGKKSAGGKVASTRNAIKCGPRSRAFVVLPNESEEMCQIQLQ